MASAYLTEALRRPLQPQAGRDPVVNVWDNRSGTLSFIKAGVDSGAVSFDEAISTGNDLLTSPNPAMVKLGMHVHRWGMWREPDLAKKWVNGRAAKLAQHDHPRIRHSNIWNVRSAIWQDPRLAGTAIAYAEEGLADDDQGVQRASIWLLGDVVSLDPGKFDFAQAKLASYLRKNPGESRDIFALERFFRPLRVPYGGDSRYVSTVMDMIGRSNGYPGLRARAANMIDIDVPASQVAADKKIVRSKLYDTVEGTPDAERVKRGDLIPVFDAAAQRFVDAQSVGEGMGALKILRYLAWLSGDLQQPFEVVGQSLTNPKDGDLARSASVFLADCTLQQPTNLAKPAVEAVTDFFGESDIDGSQIVVSLVLDPVRHGSNEAVRLYAGTLPTLHRYAANPSVNFALSNH